MQLNGQLNAPAAECPGRKIHWKQVRVGPREGLDVTEKRKKSLLFTENQTRIIEAVV